MTHSPGAKEQGLVGRRRYRVPADATRVVFRRAARRGGSPPRRARVPFPFLTAAGQGVWLTSISPLMMASLAVSISPLMSSMKPPEVAR